MMLSNLRSTIVLMLFASAVPALGATVSGTVRNAGGARLSGMIVEAYDETGQMKATGTTDVTGFYVLTVPAGGYRFLAYDVNGQYATSFAGNSDSYETSPVFEVATAATIDFTLVHGAFIQGLVLTDSGLPRSGATVAAYNMSGTRRGFTKTREANQTQPGFFFLVVPPGAYRVVAYDDAGVWSKVFYVNAPSFDQASTITLSDPGEIEEIAIFTGRAARINGKVVDASASLPLASIVVYAYTPDGSLVTTAATDNLGNFRLLVPAGSYRILAADPSRTFATEYLGGAASFAASSPVTVGTNDERNGVNFAMRRGGAVEGRVLGPGGIALEGIIVTAYNPDGTVQSSAVTDADGRYALAAREGEVIVVASDPLLRFATQFHLRAGTFRHATRLGIGVGQTFDGVDFALAEGGRLHGTVRSATGGLVAGVTVAAYDAAGMLVSSDVTDADGIYNFVVPAGDYRLATFDTSLRYASSFPRGAASYEASLPLSVAVRGLTETDFVVRTGVRVSGTVVSRAGTPLDGIEITALDSAGNNVGGAFSSAGTFTIILLPGEYRFVARDVLAQYRSVYYRDGVRFQDASVVTVTNGQIPPPLQFVLDAVSRRRSVRH